MEEAVKDVTQTALIGAMVALMVGVVLFVLGVLVGGCTHPITKRPATVEMRG